MPYTLGSLIRGGWKEISCLSHKKLQSLSVTKIFNELEEVDDFSKSSIKRLQLLLVLWISTVHHSYHGTYQEFLSTCSIEFHSIIHLPILHFIMVFSLVWSWGYQIEYKIGIVKNISAERFIKEQKLFFFKFSHFS